MSWAESWALSIAILTVTGGIALGAYLDGRGWTPPAWIVGGWTFIYNQAQRMICWCTRRSK